MVGWFSQFGDSTTWGLPSANMGGGWGNLGLVMKDGPVVEGYYLVNVYTVIEKHHLE